MNRFKTIILIISGLVIMMNSASVYAQPAKECIQVEAKETYWNLWNLCNDIISFGYCFTNITIDPKYGDTLSVHQSRLKNDCGYRGYHTLDTFENRTKRDNPHRIPLPNFAIHPTRLVYGVCRGSCETPKFESLSRNTCERK